MLSVQGQAAIYFSEAVATPRSTAVRTITVDGCLTCADLPRRQKHQQCNFGTAVRQSGRHGCESARTTHPPFALVDTRTCVALILPAIAMLVFCLMGRFGQDATSRIQAAMPRKRILSIVIMHRDVCGQVCWDSPAAISSIIVLTC